MKPVKVEPFETKKYLTTALSTSTTAAAVTTTEKTKDQSIYHLYSVLQKFPGKKK